MVAALAQRLEAAEAANGICCALAQEGAAVEQVAGGMVIFVGANSMLTHAVGLGLQGSVTAVDVDRVEHFFRSRGAAVNVDLCPYAHPTLTAHLSSRGYRIAEFNNVMVRGLDVTEAFSPAPGVRPAQPGEARLWAHTVGAGFFERDALSPEELDVGLTLFHAPGFRCFFACVDGVPAAAAAMSVHDGVALLFADSTVRAWRGRGLHAALIRARLDEAVRAGCDLAAAGVLPGSVSERNYLRTGFHVAYTKVGLIA
jgi:hypothetical protein